MLRSATKKSHTEQIGEKQSDAEDVGNEKFDVENKEAADGFFVSAASTFTSAINS